MQYHALALAVNDGSVDLIGLEGAPLHARVATESRIRTHRLRDGFASRLSGGRRRYVLLSAARAVTHAARLLTILLRVPKPGVILVQSPPASPTLGAAWIAARLRGARFIIDWHNLSHAVLAVTLGEQHRAVRALARSERRWGRRADAHLAVSSALADWLRREWGIRATVLYDQPPAVFAKPSLEAAANLWQRLARDLKLGPRRIPIVLCPSSWTPDEEFDLLLEALERAERTLGPTTGDGEAVAPVIAVILSGRGPLRADVEKRLARRRLAAVAARTAWVEPDDYLTLVGIADAGLCLHQSASGLDLPMKLADFRGAGVPVCAFDYAPVLGEALTPGHEGLTFRDPGELAAILIALARSDLGSVPHLAASRSWLAANPPERWEDRWQVVALPIVTASR
jgi:beta-1,4-mannosyltransferase